MGYERVPRRGQWMIMKVHDLRLELIEPNDFSPQN